MSAGLLRTDNVRLKKPSCKLRCCQFCYLAATEDVRYFLFQCPRWQEDRDTLLNNINEIPDGSGTRLLESDKDLTVTHRTRWIYK